MKVDRLAPRRARAVAVVLEEPTLARAAKRIGVHDRTLRRWLKDPDFRRALDEARRQAFGEALARVQFGASRAAQALLDVLDDEEARPTERVAAARALLEHAHRAEEILDLRGRLEAVEGVLEQHRTGAAYPGRVRPV